MMTGRRDLLAAALWAILAFLSIRFTDSLFLRVIMGVPLAFFLPGYVLLRAMKPIGTSPVERTVYAAGLSIAICPLGGLILNWAGWLQPAGWAAGLAATVCVIALFGLLGNRDEAAAAIPAPAPRPRIWHGAVVSGAAVIACGAYLLAIQGEASQKEFKYTELWMVFNSAKAPGRLVVGIKSAEEEVLRFDVEVAIDGRTVGMWHALAIDPGQTWTQEIAVPAMPGHPQKAQAWLYRPDENIIYRRVSAIVPGA